MCTLLGKDLKGKVAIGFVDEFGLHEAGIDGGGVFKEFLTRQVHKVRLMNMSSLYSYMHVMYVFIQLES